HDGVLLHGRLDVLWREGSRAFVLDYKTNTLAAGVDSAEPAGSEDVGFADADSGHRTPEEIVEADYRLQRLVYALACFRAGADEVEVVYHFLERPAAVVSTVFAKDQLPELEAVLSAAIDRINASAFRPSPLQYSCSGCP